jgi:hypothetical protein
VVFGQFCGSSNSDALVTAELLGYTFTITRDRNRALKQVGGQSMLWTIFLILFILWLAGMVTSYTLGGFIHILLVLAVVAIVIQLVTGRQPL